MKKVIKRIVISVIILCFSVCFITGVVYTCKGYKIYKDAIGKAGLEEKIEDIRSREDYTEIENLPDIYVDAVIAVEDHRFYSHGGIDIIATARALWTDIKAGAFIEGGSTITQQLAKNLYFTRAKKIERKIAEMFMAFKIEKNYEKDEILELYVNSIYFGDGYYCVGDASGGYFGKEPKDMSDYESTLLAGIPNAPSVYAPTNNPELAEKRQRKVIEKMVAFNVITADEAEKIIKDGAE